MLSSLTFGLLVSIASGSSHGPKTHTVTYSDTPIWTVGVGVSYADVEIKLGDTMEFASYSSHDVVLVTPPSTGTAWDQCGDTGIAAGNMTSIWATTDYTANSVTKKHWTPPTCGTFYIACSISAHCKYGQKLKLTVKNTDGSACAAPCSEAACATVASKVTVTNATAPAVIHSVKPNADSKYWGQGPYTTAGLSVNIGDTVLFRTGAGFHDVATVATQAKFDGCDMTGMTQLANWQYGKSPAESTAACTTSADCCAGSTCAISGMFVTYSWKAAAAGDTYFVCSIGGGNHCKTGQKIKVTVKTADQTTADKAKTVTSGASRVGAMFGASFLAMYLAAH